MKMLSKYLILTLILLTIALPAIIYSTSPEWCHDTIDEICNEKKYLQQLDEAAEETKKLDEELNLIKSRVAHKESIIEDVLAKKITLAHAGEKFLMLDQRTPKAIKRNYKIISLNESSQLAVLQKISACTDGQLEKNKVRFAELKKEFVERFGHQPVY